MARLGLVVKSIYYVDWAYNGHSLASYSQLRITHSLPSNLVCLLPQQHTHNVFNGITLYEKRETRRHRVYQWKAEATLGESTSEQRALPARINWIAGVITVYIQFGYLAGRNRYHRRRWTHSDRDVIIFVCVCVCLASSHTTSTFLFAICKSIFVHRDHCLFISSLRHCCFWASGIIQLLLPCCEDDVLCDDALLLCTDDAADSADCSDACDLNTKSLTLQKSSPSAHCCLEFGK